MSEKSPFVSTVLHVSQFVMRALSASAKSIPVKAGPSRSAASKTAKSITTFTSVILLSSLLSISQAQALSIPFSGEYDNREGVLSGSHDRSMAAIREKYFYDKAGSLDQAKMSQLMAFLQEQKRLLQSSAKLNRKTNLIMVHGVDNAKGEKEGLEAIEEEAETLAPLNFAIEALDDLMKNSQRMSSLEQTRKVETILLWYAAGYTLYPEGIFTSAVERFKNLRENFFDYPVDDAGQTQASNLLLPSKDEFASGEELRRLRKNGVDLSKLDPPSSAFWTNNQVEAYDPEAEIYFDRKLFPPRSIEVPEVDYERMGNGQVKFKTKWTDHSERSKKGKPKEKSLTLRVGWEAYTATVVNHLARALGYPAIPTTFRQKVKMNLGKTSFEEFLSQYKSVHTNEMGSVLTHIRRIPGENAVYVLNATLEAYPDDDDYRRIGPFRMGDNGLPNRREYRAMVLYNSLISLQDQFEYQARVDAYRDPVTKEWRPLFFIADTSSALGLPAMLGNKGTVNEFTWKFTKRTDKNIWLFWLSVFNSRAWKDATYSDLKWMARRMARLQTWQIDKIMQTSGFPEPVKALYAEKLKSRINQLITDFQLQSEGFKFHQVLSPQTLSAKYPQYINEKGFLKEGAQEIDGNTAPILGNRFTPYQGLIVVGINTIQNQFLKLFDPSKLVGNEQTTFDIGTLRGTNGVLFDASRDVKVNAEVSPGQRRYLLRDTLVVSIPIGFDTDRVKTPVAIYYSWKFEYVHSVSNMVEVGKSRFFDLVNPFSIEEIRRNLQTGEQLLVSHSMGASIGQGKLKAFEDLQVEAALLGYSKTQVKSVFFSKSSEDILEVATDSLDSKSFRNGFDVRALARLGFMLSSEKTKSKYRLYRIDLLNAKPEEKIALKAAFESALVYDDFKGLDLLSPPRFINEKAYRQSLSMNLFVWSFARNQGVSEINLNGKRLVLAHQTQSSDRAFDRLWTDDLNPKAAKAPLNYVGNFWGEGELVDVSFEGSVSETDLKFDGSEINISVAKIDNYATRDEFEREIKPFFNSRSGSKQYIDFKMPEGIDVYLEFAAKMRWQLSHAAVVDIMKAATDWNNLAFLEPSRETREHWGAIVDPREEVSFRANRFLLGLGKISGAKLSKEEKESLRNLAQDALLVIRRIIGESGERLALLRSWTRDDRIWVLTSFDNVLDTSHPSFRTTKGQIYYAPEIGKFQGHSPLKQFRRQNLMTPILADQ